MTTKTSIIDDADLTLTELAERKLAELTAEIDQMVAERIAMEERDAARDAGQPTVAERARAGELGPDWQHVQRRIDLGKTTLEDVWSGRDEDPHAEALRHQAEENLGKMNREWQDEIDAAARDGGTANNPLAQMQEFRAQMAAELKEFEDFIKKQGEDND